MFERILVPLDGSTRAEQALPVAVRIARASGGTLLLVEVVTPLIDYGGLAPVPLLTEGVITTELDEAADYLKTIARSPMLAGIATTTEVVFGLAAPNILATSEARAVDLIVICSHGRTGFTRWVLGSVARQVLHQSQVPVLVLREGTAMPRADGDHPLSALVPLDGSPLAEKALVPAIDLITTLAAPAHGALHLVQVVKQVSSTSDESFVAQFNAEAVGRAKAYLLTVQEHLQERAPKLTVTWSAALDSDAASEIINIAEHGYQRESGGRYDGGNVIAISTHGRGGLERWVIGSVTERILNTTKLPVLVVRPQKKV
jgi:nucleotide-binding universal stress UspA family protein